jgi:hypothetical protein
MMVMENDQGIGIMKAAARLCGRSIRGPIGAYWQDPVHFATLGSSISLSET